MEALRIYPCRIIVTAGVFIDILPMQFGKGEAVRFIVNRMGLQMDQVAVAGDMENDADMFAIGAHGILPSNANQGLRVAAQAHGAYLSRHACAAGLLDGLRRLEQS